MMMVNTRLARVASTRERLHSQKKLNLLPCMPVGRHAGLHGANSQGAPAPRTRAHASKPATVFEPSELDFATPPPIEDNGGDRSHETDYVVIGSGIGGLCCAALLAKYGYSVTVCESHYLPGGCAHGFKVGGYSFDAGPSFFLGLSPPANPSQPSPNPLKQVLDAIGESVECKQYDRWIMYTQDGTFPNVANADAYEATILKFGGEQALREWKALDVALKPLQTAAGLFPAAAIRADPGVLLTSLRFLGPEFLGMAGVAPLLTGPFSAVVDKYVKSPWLKSFLDLECFVLSGMTAQHTLTAEMAFMFAERNSGRSAIDYPLGGSGAVIDALVRGLQRNGGKLMMRTHVEQVLMEDGRAAGVVLRPRDGAGGKGASPSSSSSSSRPEVVRARLGVISNASVWDTMRLLPQGAGPQQWREKSEATPMLDSFVHLHLGIDATGLDPNMECHHLIVNDWSDITTSQNVIIASVPTVFDPTMAPPGKAVVHCYCAANEPYELWAGLDRRSAEYKALKQERVKPLWKALERFIPDIRERTELQMIGSPLTHERFVRRHRGSYGPGISAKDGAGWPGPKSPIPGLSLCGDSTMPGIGVPAAAASGMMAANSLAPVLAHWKMMDELLPGPGAQKGRAVKAMEVNAK